MHWFVTIIYYLVRTYWQTRKCGLFLQMNLGNSFGMGIIPLSTLNQSSDYFSVGGCLFYSKAFLGHICKISSCPRFLCLVVKITNTNINERIIKKFQDWPPLFKGTDLLHSKNELIWQKSYLIHYWKNGTRKFMQIPNMEMSKGWLLNFWKGLAIIPIRSLLQQKFLW